MPMTQRCYDYYLTYALTVLFVFFASYSVGQSQNIQTVQTKNSQKQESDITFETEDTLDSIDPGEYKPMPLPELDTTEQAPLTDEQKKEYERAIHINLKTGERSVQPTLQFDESKESNKKPGFKGIPLKPYRGIPLKPSEEETGDSGNNTIQTFNSLSQVSQPATHPWRQNVKVFTSYPNGNRVCSGALIDYEWVLTAGHCVHKDNLGGDANAISVAPGFESGKEPYGKIQATGFTVLKGWSDNDNFNYDMAWVHLSQPVGFKTGFFGTGYDSDNDFFYNNNFENPGYPGGSFSNAQIMYTSNGTFDSQFWRNESNALYQDSRSYDGQSGSGVYRTNGSPRIQYATLSSGNNNWTRYARITQNRFNSINNDIASSRPSIPDLVAMHVKASPDRLAEGDQIKDLSFILANRANVSHSGTWDIEVYLSADRDISTSDTHLSTQSLNTTIGAESYKKVNMHPVSIPIGQSGKKYIGVIVDAGDDNTSNNDTDGKDAREIKITPSHTVNINSNNPSSGVDISVYKQDNRGDEDGMTSFGRRYPEGEAFEVGAPLFVGTNEFKQWNKNGSKHSENQVISVSMGSSDMDLTAEYSIPDIPVKPLSIGVRLPENDTENDKTRTIKVVNKHSTTLEWTASESAEWLSLSPSSGSTAPGDSTTITATFSTDNTPEGSYSESITFSSGDLGDNDNTVTANLRAGGVPGAAPTPEEIYKNQELADRDLFGMAVDVDPLEKFVGMGTPGLGDGNSGGCPMLRWVDGQLTMDQVLTPEEAIDGAHFGQAVDVFTAGGVPMAMVGAPGGTNRYKSIPTSAYSGRIHLFSRSETGWSPIVSEVPQSADHDGSRFGASIDAEPVPGTSGTEYFVAVGAPGANFEGFSSIGLVFVYRVTSSGIEGPVRLNPDVYNNGMNMGHDVNLTTRGGRTLLVVGVPARDNADVSGHTLLFEYSSESWNQRQLLEAAEPSASDHFGSSVALRWSEENPALTVGMPGATVEEERDGLIQSFRYSIEQEGWVPSHQLIADNPVQNAGLGESLTMRKTSNRVVLVAGAPGIESTIFGGEAYVYQKPDGGNDWQRRATLSHEELDSNSSLGRSASILQTDGELRYLAGAPGADGEFEDEGSGLEFVVPNPLNLPAFNLSSSTFTDRVREDDSTAQTLTIESTGEAELTWDLVGSIPDWLNIDQRSGAIPSGGSHDINVEFNSTNLDTGTFTTTLDFESNEEGREVLPIEFELTVSDRPEIDLGLTSWKSLEKDTVQAGTRMPLDQQEIIVYNQRPDPVDSLFHVGLFAAPDSSLENATLISSVAVDSSLEGEGGLPLDFSPGAQMPEDLGSGTAYLVMVADYENKIPDMNESNSQMWHSIYVTEAEHPSVAFLTDISTLEVTLGKEETDTRDIRFTNNGESPLNFTIPGFDEGGERDLSTRQAKQSSRDTIPPYIENVEPGSGQVAVGDTGSFTLTMNAEGVSADTYQDTMEVVTDDPDKRSSLIPLQVEIKESTGLGDKDGLPEKFVLEANYPNPFNPETIIRYALPKATQVEIDVYNTIGRQVSTLVNDHQKAGYHRVTFDGSRLTSGVYLYRIKTDDFQKTRKMLLVK